MRAAPVVTRECPKAGGTRSRLESEDLGLPLGRWLFHGRSPSLLLAAGVPVPDPDVLSRSGFVW